MFVICLMKAIWKWSPIKIICVLVQTPEPPRYWSRCVKTHWGVVVWLIVFSLIGRWIPLEGSHMGQMKNSKLSHSKQVLYSAAVQKRIWNDSLCRNLFASHIHNWQIFTSLLHMQKWFSVRDGLHVLWQETPMIECITPVLTREHTAENCLFWHIWTRGNTCPMWRLDKETQEIGYYAKK